MAEKKLFKSEVVIKGTTVYEAESLDEAVLQTVGDTKGFVMISTGGKVYKLLGAEISLNGVIALDDKGGAPVRLVK
jgi:hypothetical protein